MKYLLALILLASLAGSVAVSAEPATTAASAATTGAKAQSQDKDVWIRFYDERYALDNVYEKRTNNHGEGDEDLYGTRNFREILKGVAYRGGGNNSFHRDAKRDNRNPLPSDGLDNLCREGFGRSYYLYRTNFDSAPPQTSCTSPRGHGQTLDYFQRNPNSEQDTYEMLRSVHETIVDFRHGPIYLHCWNGWHASGLIAAKILRQFCGLTADDAVAYWDANTDGHNTSSAYNKVRQHIREFTPYPEFELSAEDAALVCP